MTLPCLDLSLFTQGDATQRQELASQLLASLTDHGFVKLTKHGIPDRKVHELFKWSEVFFALPPQEKLAIAHPNTSEPQRGFSCVGAENTARLYRKGVLNIANVEDLRDCREHMDIGPLTDRSFPNRWPSEDKIPGFRAFMEGIFSDFEAVANAIMAALETAFSVPSGTLNRLITHSASASELRLNHYPEMNAAELKTGHINRTWPHFDLGVISLLFQNHVSGLEFEDRRFPNGEKFLKVESDDPCEMIVNVSETLQRLTNGRLRAGLHRVGAPQESDEMAQGLLKERFSVPFFCKADRNATVGSLKEFVRPGEKALYEDMSAIQFHQSRLKSAY
ncbi:MAG: hypothetical protein Q9203_004801 [Teloschistes exilis]